MRGYYRLYCPRCSTPDPRLKRGFLPWLSKIVLRRRQFWCENCSYEFSRERRDFFASILGNGREDMHAVYLPAQLMPDMEFQPEPRAVAHLNLRLLQMNIQSVAHQHETQKLMARAMEFLVEKETVFIEQQKELVSVQRHLADTVGILNEALEKANQEPLPPFSVITPKQPEPSKKDDDLRSSG